MGIAEVLQVNSVISTLFWGHRVVANTFQMISVWLNNK